MISKQLIMTLFLKYTKTDPAAVEPSRFEDGSVGYDLYAVKDVVIPPNNIVKIDTCIVFEMQGSYYGQIFDKSGFITKKKLKVVGGVIDSSYRGSIIVALHNFSSTEQKIFAFEKIAQIVFIPILLPKLIYKDEIDMDTERGDRKFGGYC